MKCYSIILLLAFPLLSFANSLIPLNEKNIKTTDVVWVAVDSDFSDEELESYTNSKLTKIIYALDYRKVGILRQYKVIVLPEEKKKTKQEKKTEKEDIFKLEGFNYTSIPNKEIPEFITVATSAKARPLSFYLLGGIVGIFLLLFGLIYKKIFDKRKKSKKAQRKIQEKKERFRAIILGEKNRKSFEEIYRSRKKIVKYLDFDSADFRNFIKEVEGIQYKEKWTEFDESNIKKLYEKMIARGVN